MTEAYILADGRDVPHNSPLARHEREVLAEHLANLRRLDTMGRRMYLSRVEASDGKAIRDKLADQYTADWTERKAHAERLKERAHGF